MVGGMIGSLFKEYFTIHLSDTLQFRFRDLNGVEWDEANFSQYTTMIFGGDNSRMIREFAKIEYAHIFTGFDEFLNEYRVTLELGHGTWELERNKIKISYEKFHKLFVDKFAYLEEEMLKSGVLSAYLDNWFIDKCSLVSDSLLNKGVWATPPNKQQPATKTVFGLR